MAFADRFAVLGVVLALIAIAVPYLWPDKKMIGWVSFFAAVFLLLAWVWMEFGHGVQTQQKIHPIRTAIIVFFAGGSVAVALWLLVVNNVDKTTNTTAASKEEKTAMNPAAKTIQTTPSPTATSFPIPNVMPLAAHDIASKQTVHSLQTKKKISNAKNPSGNHSEAGYAVKFDDNASNNVIEHLETFGFDNGVEFSGAAKGNRIGNAELYGASYKTQILQEWKRKMAVDAGDATKIRQDLDWMRSKLEVLWANLPPEKIQKNRIAFAIVDQKFRAISSNRDELLKLLPQVGFESIPQRESAQ